MGHKTTNYQMIYRFATKAASAIFFCRLKRRLIANNFDDPLIISGISVSLIWWFQFLTCQDLLIFFSFMTVNEDYLAFVLIAGQRKRFKDYICSCISLCKSFFVCWLYMPFHFPYATCQAKFAPWNETTFFDISRTRFTSQDVSAALQYCILLPFCHTKYPYEKRQLLGNIWLYFS